MEIIADPDDKKPLKLENPVYEGKKIISGLLVAESGKQYPIVNGIPRFVTDENRKSVESFGNEWNYFNFIDHKEDWLRHTVRNTFGTTDYFKNKIIIDAGGGSGSQSKWFLESGAEHVILLDLSHSVDEVVKNNLQGFDNVDVIQCSIDNPPLLDSSIEGIVYCHNVIQHTSSVEKTANSLWRIISAKGEFVFNCYPLNDQGLLRYLRHHLIYMNLRRFLSRMPFRFILAYASFVAILRLIPILGYLLDKLHFVIQGDVRRAKNESINQYLRRRFKSARLNTFDAYGSHSFQHHKSDFEILNLALSLQKDSSKIINLEKYFLRPQPIGCALRLIK